uniref:Uncharacterized protein n=1 Tax=Acrobeloides nanus TaxID=290746 RepID=A0A914EHD8_9BILA
MDVDWSAPSNVLDKDELKLDWSEGEDEEEDEKIEADQVDTIKLEAPSNDPTKQFSIENFDQPFRQQEIDFMSQHLKFIASLRIMVEELSTLASGYEVDGGQLRYELFKWLEKEFGVLRRVCDYKTDSQVDLDASIDEPDLSVDENSPLPLHEALRHDRVTLNYRIKCTIRRRRWLTTHQKLIRTLVSYCALHSAQNYRLISVHMELLLLLLEAQQDLVSIRHLNEPIPDIHSFPLLMASFTSTRMFVTSPLHFIENQRTDLLLSITELSYPPNFNDAVYKVYRLFNLSQGLSSCLYQSLSDTDNFASLFQEQSGALTKRIRTISMATDDISVATLPTKWPGVDSIVALIARQVDEEMPNLRLLLMECFISITMSLFCYAFSVYDSRWLYRLAAHEMNSKNFGLVFGGGGEKRLRSAPSRPPARPRQSTSSSNADSSSKSTDDSAAIRAKLHAKVFGTEHAPPNVQKTSPQAAAHVPTSEQVIFCWVPPRMHIVQFYAEKPSGNPRNEKNEVIYDSDDASSENEYDYHNDDDDEPKPHDCPTSYAWLLLRLASIIQIQYRIKQFIAVSGFDISDLPSLSPRVDRTLELLASWIESIEEQLDQFPGGCPPDFLPHMYIENEFSVQNAPLLRKYRTLIESGNTPFEYDSKDALPVKRLWTYLVRQENLSAHFIKYIFGRKDDVTGAETLAAGSETKNGHAYSVKIIQREHEPILSFACNSVKPNWIVVSTGREIQEIVMDPIFDRQNKIDSGLNNRVELDIALEKMVRDPIRDNDDYQLIIDDGKSKQTSLSYKITPFIVDRSRVALRKLRKRTFGGVRRLESHPTLPNYVSGASDGSIYLWEWGAEQPVFTARAAGQYAKVNKLTFSHHGNKFAAVDGDGLLCIWNATQSAVHRKPFFSQKCHTKMASDVKFLGQASTLLVTAGNSSGDQNVILWDTLMPQAKVVVHSFVGHSDGATCVVYLPHTQTIASGGRHGEICLWDIRQRQLRSTLKAFESTSVVKSLCVDTTSDLLVAGSSDGDIRVWNADANPQLLQTLTGEHVARGGFSLRQVGSSSLQGVQQLFIDSQMRLFSCGADCSLKFRPIS